jgi:hypothetical protein
LINVNKFCMDLFCHANTSAIVRDIMIYSIGSEKLIYINQRIGVENGNGEIKLISKKMKLS